MRLESPRANILLVDDQPANLLALEAVLEPLGQNLTRAYSGAEALRYLLTNECALILLDVQMPAMDGFETAKLIREREKTRQIPIIFLTALSLEQQHILRGYAVGAVDYLSKPFDPYILQSKVSVFVELYQKGKQIERQAELLRESAQREAAQQQAAASAARERALVRSILFSVTDGRLRLCESRADLPAPPSWTGAPLALATDQLWQVRQKTEDAAQAAGLEQDRVAPLPHWLLSPDGLSPTRPAVSA